MIALTIIDVIYIIANLVEVLAIRKLVCYFFDESAGSEMLEIFGYVFYYIFMIISCLIDIWIDFYLIGHFLFLLIIALNFHAEFRVKLFVAVYLFIAIQMADLLFHIMYRTTSIVISMDTAHYYIWNFLLSRCIFYVFSEILASSDRYCKAVHRAPARYLIIAASVPAVSLYVLILFYRYQISAFSSICGVLCVLCIDLLSLYLYDSAISVFSEREEWNVAAVKTAAAVKQLDIMVSSVENLRIFRHDMMNHFMVLEYYIGKSDNEKSLQYIGKMKNMCAMEQVVRTGNVVIDSILNHKITEAIRKGIDMRYEVQVSEKIDAEDFDMTCILGNLIDNAVEAAEKAEEKKVIMRMVYSDKRLSFRIRNTFSGGRRWSGNTPVTTKQDKICHGLGLRSVKRSVEKYKGHLDIRQEGSYFCVTVVMYT